MKQKNTITLILLGLLAIILFGNITPEKPSETLMAFDFDDISGWWDGLDILKQNILWAVFGIVFLTIIVQVWWKE